MVAFRAIHINWHISIRRSERNCGPRSKVITSGTPQIAIQRCINTFAQVLALAASPCIAIGKASGHPVNLSMTVSKTLFPSHAGLSGLTRSMCMILKRLIGAGNRYISDLVWTCTLAFWQASQAFVHFETALPIHCHQYGRLIKVIPAFTSGWVNWCKLSNTTRCNSSGTSTRAGVTATSDHTAIPPSHLTS